MRNIFLIFAGDAVRLYRNLIAWVVIVGVVVVPPLYAWFNIAASWDPYSNTGNLKVAIANCDKGYSGDIIKADINVGEIVLSKVRENDSVDWQFVDNDEALEGVRSGRYYAAIVIPESFSDDMMSFFSSNVEHSDIIYLLNEKENAIAPKVTNKVASTLSTEINRSFFKVMIQVAESLADTVNGVVSSDDRDRLLSDLISNLKDARGNVEFAGATMRTYGDLTGSLQRVLDSSEELLKITEESLGSTEDALKGAGVDAAALTADADDLTGQIDGMLTSLRSSYSRISESVDDGMDDMDSDAGNISDTVSDLRDSTDKSVSDMEDFRDSLEEIRSKAESGTESQGLILNNVSSRAVSALDDLIDGVDDIIDREKHLSSTLGDLKDDSQELSDAVSDDREAASAAADDAAAAIDGLKDSFDSGLREQLEELFGSVADSCSQLADMLSDLEDTSDDTLELLDDAGADLTEIGSVLESSADSMDEVTENMDQLIAALESGIGSDDLGAVGELIENDPEALSSFMAAPVSLKKNAVYSVANYGAAMTPFYTDIAIWVAGIVLVAMFKVTLEEKRRREMKDLRHYQVYLGRGILFFMLGLFQAGLTALGDLFFLHVEMVHPFMFFLVCLGTSLLFVCMSYTLTYALGDVGKAASIILMVVQVAGSGGTFPIEMAPKFFRMVYPFLPFVHSMNAMRECISGYYGDVLLKETGILGAFFAGTLLFGILLKGPILRMNRWFTEKLESSRVI